MITASALRSLEPQPGSICWMAFGNGVRRVLLRRFTRTGIARVSKRGSLGQWQWQEIDALPCNLFPAQEDALAWYRVGLHRLGMDVMLVGSEAA